MALKDAKTPAEVLDMLGHDINLSDADMQYVDGVFVSYLGNQVVHRRPVYGDNGRCEYTLCDRTRVYFRRRPDGLWKRWIDGQPWP